MSADSERADATIFLEKIDLRFYFFPLNSRRFRKRAVKPNIPHRLYQSYIVYNREPRGCVTVVKRASAATTGYCTFNVELGCVQDADDATNDCQHMRNFFFFFLFVFMGWDFDGGILVRSIRLFFAYISLEAIVYSSRLNFLL